jgi:hypothetical protein
MSITEAQRCVESFEEREDPELSMSGGGSVAPMGMGTSKYPFKKKGSESRVDLVHAPTWTRNLRNTIIIYRIETLTLPDFWESLSHFLR